MARAIAWVGRRTDGDMATLWVVEGIGSYGARLAGAVAQSGYQPVEAARMDARGNRGVGKSDPLDVNPRDPTHHQAISGPSALPIAEQHSHGQTFRVARLTRHRRITP